MPPAVPVRKGGPDLTSPRSPRCRYRLADLSTSLDKSYEDQTLDEVLAAPVSALAGVTNSDADHLAAAFNIRTVADLGRNKYFAAAQAMLVLTT